MAQEGSQTNLIVGSGGVIRPFVTGNLYAPLTITSANGTGSTVLITGAPGYVITEIGYHADLTCTLAAAGMVDVNFSDSSAGTVANFRLFVPMNATAPTVATTIRQVNQGPIVWNNKVANSTLSASITTALVLGSIRVFVRYALVNFLG